MAATDSELAARAKQGDLSAYEELMRRHWEAVYRVAHAIVRDHDLADDALQECFLQAHGALRRFDESRAFAPWAKGIAVNCARRIMRRQNRAEQPTTEELLVASGDDPHERNVANDLEAAVGQAITQLPLQQRTAMRLFALDGMDLAETASVMGCAVGTVKTHLHRARRRLRELLSDYLEENEDNEL